MSALRDIRLARGLTMESLAQKAGTTASQINKLEKGQRRLTDMWVHRLSRALECTADELAEKRDGGAGIKLDPELYTLVPVYALRHPEGEAGLGSVLHRAAFLKAYLRDLSNAPFDKLAIFRIDDDAMINSLRPGDQVLVELAGNDGLRGDGCYVLQIGGGSVVRRVTINPETRAVSIHVDNPLYSNYDNVSPENVKVIGRVIWMGRKV